MATSQNRDELLVERTTLDFVNLSATQRVIDFLDGMTDGQRDVVAHLGAYIATAREASPAFDQFIRERTLVARMNDEN